MLLINIPEDFNEFQIWEDQLKEWCVAHKIAVDASLSEPELIEGTTKKAEGTQSINEFLEEYKSFMDEWYDCRCDRDVN